MVKNERSISVLVPDGHSHLFPSVLIGLSEVKGLRIYAMTTKRIIPARFSRFITKIHAHHPELAAVAWVELINELVQKYNIDIVMPVHDPAIRRLIEHAGRIKNKDRFLLPPSLEAFDQAKDKDRLSDLLKEMGIPVPESWHLPQVVDLQALPKESDFPVLLKPTRESGSGRGILEFDRKQDLVAYLSEHPPKTPCFLQRRIEGYDLGCHMLCKNGEILAFTMQKGFLFSPRPFTPQVGMRMIYEEEVFHLASAVMKRLAWNGMADMDLRYDQNRKAFTVLEINPRFWLTLVASQVAGVNYPMLYCQTVLGNSFAMPEYKKCDYYTWNGLRVALKKQPSLFLNPIAVWKKSPLKYAFRDPLMTLVEFLQTVQIFFRSKFRG